MDKNAAEAQTKILTEENLRLKHVLSSTENNLQLAEARLKRQENVIEKLSARA